MVVRELLISLGVITDSKGVEEFDRRITAAKAHLERAQVATTNMRAAVSDLVGWFLRGATAAVGVVSGLAYLTDQTTEYALAVERQAAALGITTDAYQEVRKVFEKFGVDQRDIADLFSQIAQQAVAAADGGDAPVKAFEALGIATEGLEKMGPVELLEAIADGAERTTDPTKRLAAVGTLLGEDLSKKLGPLLLQGSKGLAKFREEVRKSGAVMSTKAIAASKAYRATMGQLKLTLESVRNELAMALLPVLAETATAVLEYVKANREAISSGIERFAARVHAGFVQIRDVVIEVDRAVRERFGGWEAVLFRVAGGVAFLASAFAAFKVGSAIYYGLTAIEAVISAVAVIAGVTFSVAAAGIATLLVGLGQLVLVFGVTYLFWQDLFTLIDGGTSVIGSFLDEWRGAPGVLGEVARAGDALVRILSAVFTIAGQIGDYFATGFMFVINTVADGIRGWILLFDYLSTPLQNVLAYLADSGWGVFATLLERTAEGLERLAGIPSPTTPTASAMWNGVDLGETTLAGMRPPPPTAAGGASSVSNTTTVGGNTYNVTSTDPMAIVTEITRRDAAQRRAALQGLGGADQ